LELRERREVDLERKRKRQEEGIGGIEDKIGVEGGEGEHPASAPFAGSATAWAAPADSMTALRPSNCPANSSAPRAEETGSWLAPSLMRRDPGLHLR